MITTKIFVKGIKVKYAKFMSLLSIPKRLLLILIKLAPEKNAKCKSLFGFLTRN